MTRWVALCSAFLLSLAAVAHQTPTVVLAESVAEQPELVATNRAVQTTGLSLSSPNDSVPWGLDRLDQRGPISATTGNRSYTYNSTGAGVNVYVIDSGVQASHSDFGGRVQNGWSYRADNTSRLSYISSRNSYNSDPTTGIPPCDQQYQFVTNGTTYVRQLNPATYDGPSSIDVSDVGKVDNDGHGTHVAGVIAGTLAGVAKDANIIPVRVLDSCGNGTTTMIVRGLEWVLAQHVPGQKSIVNLSLGFGQVVTSVDAVITSLIQEGAMVVAAAGNTAESSCGTTPAGTLGTFSIGSSASQFVNGGFTDVESGFSNYGDCVDMFAPGSTVGSTWSYLEQLGSSAVANPFVAISGTSMAAPHVAGALARYLQTVSLTSSASTEVSVNAWSWLRQEATCNAVTYSTNNRVAQTANRLLAINAPVTAPCAPTNVVATPAVESTVITWDEPVAFNGEAPTYVATLTPGGRTCTTTTVTCTVTGLEGDVQYAVSVVASNSAGSSAPQSINVIPTAAITLRNVQIVAGASSLQATWTGDVNDGATYTVVASPGGAQCVTTSMSCSISGLVNNQEYSVVISASNSTSTHTATGSVTPNGVPATPSVIRTSTGVSKVTFSWDAVVDSLNPTYQLSSRDGRYSCTTTLTSCTISNLPNGKLRTLYLKTSTTAGGVSLTETSIEVHAGFKVRRNTLAKSTRPLLTSIVGPVSKGKRTWRSSPSCQISGARLLTPSSAKICYLTVKVAKYKSYPAMSVRVKLQIR